MTVGGLALLAAMVPPMIVLIVKKRIGETGAYTDRARVM